jgi:hypothetical protein
MGTILLMLNNYFHDFATALLIANLVLVFAFVKGLAGPLALRREQLAVVLAWSNRVSAAALFWIVVGGAIRTYNYATFEWVEAAGKGQVAALGVKHAVMGTATLAGLYLQVLWTYRFRKTGTLDKAGPR